MIKEACTGNIREAINAAKSGADRIELCENLQVGGTTPSAGTIALAKNLLQIPVMVLIRPREGDFVYSEAEIEVMKYDIEFCKKTGVAGVVFGMLTADKTIDLNLLKELVALAKPLEITFHKAIDETTDIEKEFKKLLDLGIDRVLTSGGNETALEGSDVINKLANLSAGKIKIIAAGKITKDNLPEISNLIQTDQFHGKKIVGELNRY